MGSSHFRVGTARRFLIVDAASVGDAHQFHIFLPFEGVPASLGPGLRTVSGAKFKCQTPRLASASFARQDSVRC